MTEPTVPFVFQVSVRYSDLDTNNHVNNTRFGHYLEEARTALIREFRVPTQGFVIARTEVDFVAPIRYEPDPVNVAVWVETIGHRSVTLGYSATHHGTLRAKARVVLAMFNYEAQTTRVLSDEERSAYERITYE